MKISKIQKGLVLLTVTAGMFAIGCELIVDFDRTKIPSEGIEASIPDVSIPETSTPIPDGGSAGDADAADTTDAADASDASDAADANDQ